MFKSQAEADAADREFYRGLTMDQRWAIFLELMQPYWFKPDGTPVRLERVARVFKREPR